MLPEPREENSWLVEHATLLLDSYRALLGRDLVDPRLTPAERARTLFHAPYGVFSHSADPDPLFTYGNLTALSLFDLDWTSLQGMPSRLSAAAADRDERRVMLEGVARDGHYQGYRGLRLSRTGRRFWIEDVCVWNLTDATGAHLGQAAVYGGWTYVTDAPG